MSVGVWTIVGLLLGGWIARARERRADYRLWVALGMPPYVVASTTPPTSAELHPGVLPPPPPERPAPLPNPTIPSI